MGLNAAIILIKPTAFSRGHKGTVVQDVQLRVHKVFRVGTALRHDGATGRLFEPFACGHHGGYV